MNPADLAVNLFAERFNCAQAVFAAYAPALGLEQAPALKIATAFGGGGLGARGGACGAVSGALLVLGLRYGMAAADDQAAKTQTYALAHAFADRFKERHGHLTCRELLGCDLGTPEGAQMAQARQFHTTFCPALVRSAAEILDELLQR